MNTTEIFVAYIKSRSAYKIVTPYKTVMRVLACHPDDAVLEALLATRSRNAVLITKSNRYELLSRGISPRDETERAIQRILYDKNITYMRIDESSQKELVAIMDDDIEAEKAKLNFEKQVRQAEEQAVNGKLDKLPDYLKDKILAYAAAQRTASQLHNELIAELDRFQVPFQNLSRISSDAGEAIPFGAESDAVATDGLSRLINGNYRNSNKLIADIEKVFLHYANKKSGV